MFAMPICSRVAPERIGCLRVSEEIRNGILQHIGFAAQQSVEKRPAVLQMIGHNFFRAPEETPYSLAVQRVYSLAQSGSCES